jgi:hypothetical protein
VEVLELKATFFLETPEPRNMRWVLNGPGYQTSHPSIPRVVYHVVTTYEGKGLGHQCLRGEPAQNFKRHCAGKVFVKLPGQITHDLCRIFASCTHGLGCELK